MLLDVNLDIFNECLKFFCTDPCPSHLKGGMESCLKLADYLHDESCLSRHSQEGWPNSMYGVSKLCESTYMRILAGQLQQCRITVSACCPGYVNTDLSSHRGVKTTAEGADTPTFLALLLPPDQTGQWWEDQQSHAF